MHGVGGTPSSTRPSRTPWPGVYEHMLKPPPTHAPITPPGLFFCGHTSVPRQFGGVGRPHGKFGMPSSMRPSQSLSQPSQISGDGMHPLHIGSSSTWPLQSLSCPSHTSEEGQCAGLPHLTTFSSTMPLQLLSMLSQLSLGS